MKWMLNFNVIKSFIMHLGSTNTHHMYFTDDFNTLNQKLPPLLYMTLVKPHLEYTNVVWGLNYIGDCDMMERAQKRATRCVQELSSLDYDECRTTIL